MVFFGSALSSCATSRFSALSDSVDVPSCASVAGGNSAPIETISKKRMQRRALFIVVATRSLDVRCSLTSGRPKPPIVSFGERGRVSLRAGEKGIDFQDQNSLLTLIRVISSFFCYPPRRNSTALFFSNLFRFFRWSKEHCRGEGRRGVQKSSSSCPCFLPRSALRSCAGSSSMA